MIGVRWVLLLPRMLPHIVLAALAAAVAVAQPSPEVQANISAAIKAASQGGAVDYTAFVNPFIGTGMNSRSLCLYPVF
jgi:hypothetical protein